MWSLPHRNVDFCLKITTTDSSQPPRKPTHDTVWACKPQSEKYLLYTNRKVPCDKIIITKKQFSINETHFVIP